MCLFNFIQSLTQNNRTVYKWKKLQIQTLYDYSLNFHGYVWDGKVLYIRITFEFTTHVFMILLVVMKWTKKCSNNSWVPLWRCPIQYIPRNMHTVFALLCFVVVIHWLIFPYPSGLLHWHCGNLTIAPVPAKQPWWIWINTSCKFTMNDCITTTKQSTIKPCAYFFGYTV